MIGWFIIGYAVVAVAMAIVASTIKTGGRVLAEIIACVLMGMLWPLVIVIRLWALFFQLGGRK